MHKRVWVPRLDPADLFQDAFNSLAREAAPMYEAHLRLQKVLAHLHDLDDGEYGECARKYSAIALVYSDNRLLLEEEKMTLHRVVVAAGPARTSQP